MKYNLELRSVANSDQPIPQKHDQFIRSLDAVPSPWCVQSQVLAPDPGSALSASLKISKLLGKGLRGDLVYQFRRAFRDEAAHDDYLNISFDPAKLDYKELVFSVFPRYVSAFDAYYGEIADDDFIFMDYEAKKKRGLDKRHSVYRLAPVSFIGQSLCRRAFGLDVETVVSRLANNVEFVKADQHGVFIVISSEALPANEMDVLCWNARALLA